MQELLEPAPEKLHHFKRKEPGQTLYPIDWVWINDSPDLTVPYTWIRAEMLVEAETTIIPGTITISDCTI